MAACAASSGSLPRTDLPSESSTIAAGALPLIVASAALIASPVAVVPAALTDCSASRTASWSRVGDCSTSARWLKAMAPTRTSSGISCRNVPAAFFAAARRVGATSVASIEPDRSVTIITRACSVGTATLACGLASATSSAASATPYPVTAAWRRQPARTGATDGRSAAGAKACGRRSERT